MKKTRLTAILSALGMAFAMTVVPAAAATPPNLHDEALMTDEEKKTKEYCDIVINLINNERTSRGLTELKTFPALNEATCIRAQELPIAFSHNRPDGSICFTAITNDMGITVSGRAENIAAGRPDPASTVQQWMDSDGHRKNILGTNYTHLGIGYYYTPPTEASPFEYYWGMFLISRYNGLEPYIYDGQYIPERSFGDADGSHEINAADASFILRYATSKAVGVTFNPPTGFIEAADINKDGNMDAIDASAILEYAVAKGAGNIGNLEDYVW